MALRRPAHVYQEAPPPRRQARSLRYSPSATSAGLSAVAEERRRKA